MADLNDFKEEGGEERAEDCRLSRFLSGGGVRREGEGEGVNNGLDASVSLLPSQGREREGGRCKT